MPITNREIQRRANAVTVVIAQLSLEDPRTVKYRSILNECPYRDIAYVAAIKLAREHGHEDIVRDLETYPTV